MEGEFEFQVRIGGIALSNVAMDRGFQNNLMTTEVADRVGIRQLLPTPERLRIKNGDTIRPEGLVRNVQTQIGDETFELDFLIVDSRIFPSFSILLNSTWLH